MKDLWNIVKARLLYCVGRFFRGLDFPGIQRVADVLGLLMWVFLFRRREETVQRVKKHLQLTEPEARVIAKSSFINTMRSFMEIFLNTRFTDEYVHFEDRERFEAMLDLERPSIFASAHFGSWELLASFIGKNVRRPSLSVARQQKDKVVSEFIKNIRGESSHFAVDHREAAKPILQCLRNGGGLGVLVDHNASRQEAIFLPFLQDTAAVNVGPALLAIRAKAIVYPIFLRRDGLRNYRLSMDEPLDTTTLEGSLAEKVEQVALFYTRAVEKKVLETPEQWLWIHRRWKTRPPAPNSEAGKSSS